MSNFSPLRGKSGKESPTIGCNDFLTPVPIRKHSISDFEERGTGYDYQCDNILRGFQIPTYANSLHIAAPFSFQVAGHDPFLKANNGLLCKPSVPRELWFYLLLRQKNFSHFLPYVSDFLGCVEFSRDDLRRFASSVKEYDSQEGNEKKYITPWAEKLHHGHLKRIENPALSTNARYLVMRDLTASFDRPCIMDVKMGQRAYGDDATESKQQSQQRKAKATTSWETGIRVCGCQGYSVEHGEFWLMHKYEGRKLTADTLSLAFERFFQNGRTLRCDVIESFLTEARAIEQEVKKCEFRFYSTSLLLVYDGAREDEPRIHLKMIDFSHTFLAEPSDIIDDGYLFGLRTLIDILEGLLVPPAEP